MSYNISNTGNTLSVAPFAHYRFDNLDTNLLGTNLSAVDDQSGNNRHLTAHRDVGPLIAPNLWDGLDSDMTCLRFTGEQGLQHAMSTADQFSHHATPTTLVVVCHPEWHRSGSPGFNKNGTMLAIDYGPHHHNNYNFRGMTHYNEYVRYNQYYPGRSGDSNQRREILPSGPEAMVLESPSWSLVDPYGVQLGNNLTGPVINTTVQDWHMASQHESTYRARVHDRTTLYEYEFYTGGSTNWIDQKAQSIYLGRPVTNRHTSYDDTHIRVYEAFVFDRILTSSDRQALTTYLTDKYDLLNRQMVDTKCVHIPFGEELKLSANKQSLSPHYEGGQWQGTSLSVDLWFRMNNISYDMPGRQYINNLDTGAKTNMWVNFFHEHAQKYPTSSIDSVGRASIRGYLYGGLYYYNGNYNHAPIHYIQNNQWNHVKWIVTDYNDTRGSGYYKTSIVVNGWLCNYPGKQQTNYKYLDINEMVAGLGETLGLPPASLNDWDGYDRVNYERARTARIANPPREQSGFQDDPAKHPTDFTMDVAGYSVTLDEFESTDQIIERYGNMNNNKDEIILNGDHESSVFADYSLSATKISNGVSKPSATPDRTTPAGDQPKADQDLLGWQFAKAMYKPAPIFQILGKEQWGTTSARWNNTLYLNSRRLTDLDWLSYSDIRKTFKNTSLYLYSNKITSVSGLDLLYGEDDHSGGDAPTVRKDIRLHNNMLTTLQPLTNSTFGKNCKIQYLYLQDNKLQNINGMGSLHDVYHTIDLRNNRELENVDVLENTAWNRAGDFSTGGCSLNFAGTARPFRHWSGSGGLSMSNNKIADLTGISCSGMSYLSVASQRPTYETNITGLNDLWMPNCYSFHAQSNMFDVTSLSDVNITNRWNRLAEIDLGATNIEDISALADLSGFARSAASDRVSDMYTGYTYINQDDNGVLHTAGVSAGELAVFHKIDATWYPDDGSKFVDYKMNRSLDRTNGLTQKYNDGKRIWLNRELTLDNLPLHDLRIFKYAFHGLNSWYSPHPNHHNATMKYADMSSGPNTTGVFKNWSKVNKVNVSYNNLTHLNDWFVDTGFHDGTDADDRSFWQTRRSFEYVYVNDNQINDLSFMLKTNFAGVKYLYLGNNDITYQEVDRIADDLIALKAAGDVNLIDVHMQGTTWDDQYLGYNYQYYDNAAYYRSGGSHWGYTPAGYTHPMSATGTDTPLYSEKARALGWQGQQYELGYTPEALLRKKLLDAGINFRFNRNSTNYINGLGSSTSDFTQSDADWNNYHSTYANHYRWGHDIPGGRLILTESDTTESSTNSIEISISNHVDMYPGDTITLRGLNNMPMASNNSYPVGGTLGAEFGGSGVWDQAAGTLTLTIQSNKTMVHQTLYNLTFDVTNPTYDDDITTGHSGTKYPSGRYVYVDATDRHGIDRTDNLRTSCSERIGPTTQ